MPWPWIIVGISVAGLVMLIGFAVWLVHKASDVLAELQVLGDRAMQGVELLEAIRIPDGDERAYGREIYDPYDRYDPDHDPDAPVPVPRRAT